MNNHFAIWKHICASLAICGFAVWHIAESSPDNTQKDYPGKSVQVVVPYAAGGGTDNFVRLITRHIAEAQLWDEAFVIINQPGGSGTIGSRYVKDYAS